MKKFTPLAKVLHLTEWLFLPKICQSSFSFGKRLFRVSASGEWLSTGNGKEYFRPDALRAVDWPSTPQTICGKGTLYTILPLVWELFLKKKNIFLVLPYSFSTLHVTYLLLSILNVCLDILIPYICLERKCWYGRKKTSHCLRQVLFNEVKKPKNTHRWNHLLHL